MIENFKLAWRKTPRKTRPLIALFLVAAFLQIASVPLTAVGTLPPTFQPVLFGALIVIAVLTFLVLHRGSFYICVRALPTILIVLGLPLGLWWSFQDHHRHLTWAVIPFYSVLAFAAVSSVLTLQAFGDWRSAVKARTTNAIFWAAQGATAIGVLLWPSKNSAKEFLKSPTSIDIGVPQMATGLVTVGTFGLVFFIAGTVRDSSELWAGQKEGTFQALFKSEVISEPIRRLASRHRSPMRNRAFVLVSVAVMTEWWLAIFLACFRGHTLVEPEFKTGLVLGIIPTAALTAAWGASELSASITRRYPPRNLDRSGIRRNPARLYPII